MKKTQDWLLGDKGDVARDDLGRGIAFNDSKIRFLSSRCEGRVTLDIGCVQHNPQNYKSRYWLHRALKERAKQLVGLDLYAPGVEFLSENGYEVITADAQNFNLNQRFEVIVAGDLIEHLDCVAGFLRCCREHLVDGGRLLISTPNPWYWKNSVKAALKGEVFKNAEHACWFCPVTLKQVAARFGFRVVDVRFGSRGFMPGLIPLPRAVRHTSFFAELEVA